MARLNEVPQSTDSYDTRTAFHPTCPPFFSSLTAYKLTFSLLREPVRRKLLRQNRELARVNSSQSLRIRHLENECARMLSENLELRGQILTLEKEVENSKAQRVADHALEIKAKLEAQLVECGEPVGGSGTRAPG